MVKVGSVCFGCNNHQGKSCTKNHPLKPKDGKEYLITWCRDRTPKVS